MTESKDNAEPSGASGGYGRFALFVAAMLVLQGAGGCFPPTPEVDCVVRIYRPDGALHKEFRGRNRGLPVIRNVHGAAWTRLGERIIDAAAGWQIEVEREAERQQP